LRCWLIFHYLCSMPNCSYESERDFKCALVPTSARLRTQVRAHVEARARSSSLQTKPVEAPRPEGQLIRLRPDLREGRCTQHLDGRCAFVSLQIKFNRLRGLRQVEDAEHRLVLISSSESEYLAVFRFDELHRAAPEDVMSLAQLNNRAHPIKQRRIVTALRFDVDRLITVNRICDRWKIESFRVGERKTSVAITRPLHRRAHAVAVA